MTTSVSDSTLHKELRSLVGRLRKKYPRVDDQVLEEAAEKGLKESPSDSSKAMTVADRRVKDDLRKEKRRKSLLMENSLSLNGDVKHNGNLIPPIWENLRPDYADVRSRFEAWVANEVETGDGNLRFVGDAMGALLDDAMTQSSKISCKQIKDWIAKTHGKNLSESTISRVREDVRNALRAVLADYLPFNEKNENKTITN